MNIMNKKLSHSLVCISSALLLSALPALTQARDSAAEHSIADAMQTTIAKSLTGVQFYFGSQKHPAIQRSIGTFSSKKTTNAFNKTDAQACQWAFLGAIKSLHNRAVQEGGNAVINIKSITTGQAENSQSSFLCRAGNVVAKVYLSGDVVKL